MSNPTLAIIGLGYVGTPLLAAFAVHFEVIGFDIDAGRVEELQQGKDRTGELDTDELSRVRDLPLTADPEALARATVYIVTVPTPVHADHTPDLTPLQGACRTLGPVLAKGDTVIFESTVFPGATEEVCVPLLEQLSGLTAKDDFWYGYSPERINPGDKANRLQSIVKVTSGCCDAAAEFIDGLYAKVVPAGTYRAASVRVAEAAKVIENTQRDVNIALVNELAMLFDRLGLDTRDVLEAAGTKWNFLPFEPGLVGGHCIGVDPYYLTHKAREVGFNPNIILSGRGVNDGMADWVAGKVRGLMLEAGIEVGEARVLVLGLTFKENCPDTRNSQVFKLVRNLRARGCDVDVWDPWVNGAGQAQEVVERLGGAEMVDAPVAGNYNAIITAVPHNEFKNVSTETFRGWAQDPCIVYDLKGILSREQATARL